MSKYINMRPIDIIDMPKFNDRPIYGDASAVSKGRQDTMPGYAVRQNMRKTSRRKVKTTSVVGSMLLFAAAALLYVGNVITVNNLAKEVNDLNAQYRKVVAMNELIKAEINRKSSLDRISLLAQEELAMTNPNEAPTWFEIDRAKEAELLDNK